MLGNFFFLWKNDQVMQQAARGSSGVTIPVDVQETRRCGN